MAYRPPVYVSKITEVGNITLVVNLQQTTSGRGVQSEYTYFIYFGRSGFGGGDGYRSADQAQRAGVRRLADEISRAGALPHQVGEKQPYPED